MTEAIWLILGVALGGAFVPGMSWFVMRQVSDRRRRQREAWLRSARSQAQELRDREPTVPPAPPVRQDRPLRLATAPVAATPEPPMVIDAASIINHAAAVSAPSDCSSDCSRPSDCASSDCAQSWDCSSSYSSSDCGGGDFGGGFSGGDF